MNKLKTAIELSKNLFTTGALFQTSSKVEKEICSRLSSEENQVVVEFGIGHGNITREILSRMSPSSTLYAFEVVEEFCEVVRKEIKDKRLHIINAGAEEIANYVDQEVDNIISSIPITILPKEKRDLILSRAYSKLKPGGVLSQVQYSKMSTKTFKKGFDRLEIVTVKQFPPEIIYHCLKNQ